MVGEIKGGETAIRMLCEKNLFSMKENLMFQEMHVAFSRLTHCTVISSKFFSIPSSHRNSLSCLLLKNRSLDLM